MPVSSPSYFPPPRGTDQIVGITAGLGQTGARVFLAGQGAGNQSTASDLILIGHQSGDAGLSGPTCNGTQIIGPRSLGALQVGNTAGPCLIFGGDNLTQVVNQAYATIAIGVFITPSVQNLTSGSLYQNVFVGHNILERLGAANGGDAGCLNNVILGFHAAQGAVGGDARNYGGNVVIGSLANRNWGTGAGGQVNNCVFIGHDCAIALGGSTLAENNTILGAGAGNVLDNASHNTIVGAVSTPVGPSNSGNVLIGAQIGCSGDHNTLLGTNIGVAGTRASRCIVIGYQADFNELQADDQLIIGNSDGSDHRALLYGQLNTGNLLVGKSTVGVNRDFAGLNATNILKLLNGTLGTANPVGGGYFYVSAGAIHWVGSAGTDTVIAPA